MIDQLIISNKASFDDFGASLKERKIGQPSKKIIKETVPFSNKTYDFTAINGEIYWEERELEYVFEITAPTPEKLEEAKAAFASWVMNIMNEDIHDPFIPDYHFKGTYEDMEFEDEEGLDKTTATVVFTAYPYKIANLPKVCEVKLASYGEKTSLTILNNSSHIVTPTLSVEGSARLEIGNISYAMSEGEYTDETVKLPVGLTTIHVENTYLISTVVRISFYEEVF